MWQGACGLADADGLVSPAYVVLAPKDGIDSRFAYHWFKSDRMIYLFWAYSHGLTEDRLRLYFDDFAEIPIAPPPLDQQRRIVAVLDAWDRAIDQTGRMIAAETKRRSVILGDLFGRDQFQRLPIGELANCYSGGTPERGTLGLYGGAIPWVKSGEVVSSNITLTEESLTEMGLATSSAKWVPAGSTLIAMYGANAGQVGRLGIDATTNQALLAVVPNARIMNSEFLYHSVLNSIPSLMRKVQGSGQPNLSGGIIKEEKIAVPSMEDQARIAGTANVLETSLQHLNSLRMKLISQKVGILQKLRATEWQLDGSFDAMLCQSPIAAGASA